MAISSAMSDGSKRKPHFFKILLGDFKKRLKIPPKFMKHIKKEAFQRVILQGPSGSRCKVKLSETIEGNFLSVGWSKFVKDHSLNEHEFLIFRYEGNMRFSVTIFDTTACEREEASEMKTPKKSACERKNKGGRGRPRKLSNDANCIVPHQSSRRFGHEKQIGGGHEKNTILDSSHPDSAIVCNGYGPEKQIGGGHEENTILDSSHPDSTIVCNGFGYEKQIGGGHEENTILDSSHPDSAIVCNGFGHEKQNGGGHEENTILDSSQPDSAIVCNGFGHEKQIGGGHEENTILDSSQPDSAIVCNRFGHEKQIGGGHEENTILDGSHPDSAIVCNGQHESPKSTNDYRITNENVEMLFGQHESPKSTNDFRIANENVEMLFSKPPSRTYFVSRRRPVTTKERSIAKEAAKSFHSPFPYTIICILKLHDEETLMLKFPISFSRKHLPFFCESVSAILRDPCGREWIVTYIPFISSLCDGWSDFARGNRIKKYDFCAFELVGASEFRVHIFRVVEETTFLARLTVDSH